MNDSHNYITQYKIFNIYIGFITNTKDTIRKY